jgi:proline dehydrogenase
MPVGSDLPLSAVGHVGAGTQRSGVADECAARRLSITAIARRTASRIAMPLVGAAARSYIAGERIEQGLGAARLLQGQGRAVCIGYWNADADGPAAVVGEYLKAFGPLSRQSPAGYVSIKLPALGGCDRLPDELVEQALAHNVRIHFDAMWPATVGRTIALVDRLLEVLPSELVGFTLPGRWVRSVKDAEWVVERDINVRVVKGQWTDPDLPEHDPRAGYLQVIDALAGRARHVAVASHDVTLAGSALQQLQSSRTSCELELLYGLPMKAAVAQADQFGVPVRVYVPYGQAFLPYAMSQLKQNPRIAWWLLRDLVMRSR